MGTCSKPALLIVDDEPALLTSYKLILERSGYEVATAATSAQAYDLLEQTSFDMLLCDLGLETPHEGMEVMRHARHCYPELVCILLTGYLDEDTSEQARKCNIQALSKPVEVAKLLHTIDLLLQGKNGRRA